MPSKDLKSFSSRHLFVGFLVSVTICFGLVHGKVETRGPDGSEGTISFGQDMNDEGDFSEHMPAELKCDACKLIAKKLTEKLDTVHKKRPSLKYLPESELLEAVDTVCQDKFEQYGAKSVRGVNRLTGPGMEANAAPGVMQSGGRWPQRIMEMCKNYMGILDEEEVYRMYKKYRSLEKYLCHGSGVRADCVRSGDGQGRSEGQDNDTARRKRVEL